MNLNFFLTCRPITLWPAFSFPASKLRACFSAYLTPISIVVWKPLVFAYLGRGKIEYSVFKVYFLLLEHWLYGPDPELSRDATSSFIFYETLSVSGWEKVTVLHAIWRQHSKATQVSCQKDILQGLVSSCEPPQFCVCTRSTRARLSAVKNPNWTPSLRWRHAVEHSPLKCSLCSISGSQQYLSPLLTGCMLFSVFISLVRVCLDWHVDLCQFQGYKYLPDLLAPLE